MNEDYKRGQRDGIRWAITWLHQSAREMNDPNAKTVLNTAAFHIGVEAKEVEILASALPSSEEDRRFDTTSPLANTGA